MAPGILLSALGLGIVLILDFRFLILNSLFYSWVPGPRSQVPSPKSQSQSLDNNDNGNDNDGQDPEVEAHQAPG